MNLFAICLIAALSMTFADQPTTMPTRSQSDLVYRTVDDVDLTLDIHRPTSDRPAPAVIYIHGGGWMSGDKAADFGFKPFTDAGLVVVSINYRLAPDHRWPACREDVAAAIAWVKDHAADHGIDASRLAIMGYSAGGHLAMDAVTRPLDAVTRPLDAAVREKGLRAAVGIAAPTDLVIDNYRRKGPSKSMQNLFDLPADAEGMNLEAAMILYDNSPINHLTSAHPPTLLLAGDADQSVPHALSEHYKARLDSVGVKCDLITQPGAGHRLREYRDGWERDVAAWLVKTLAPR